MVRFKIEDLVAQDKDGVVFRAMDSESDHAVAIWRFFLFGQNGGGLDKDEALAFGSASARLTTVEHESLRAIVLGAVDPIDRIPYLVTEWVEGESLSLVLSNDTMEPALVIDVLRIALEVSILLSDVLGEQAVWVETGLDSIVVGNQESGRGFTFCISPLKWLGENLESRRIFSIVKLGEQLTGWEKKLVSDQAGHGLGGWLKRLRSNPDTSLKEALDSLAALAGGEAPSGAKPLGSLPRKPAVPMSKQSSSKVPVLLTAALAFLIAGLSFFYFQKNKAAPAEIAATAQKKNIPETQKPAPLSAKKPKETQAGRVNALAEKLAKEAADGNAVQKEQDLVKDKLIAAEEKSFLENGRILTPGQFHLVRTFPAGTAVSIRGVPKNARGSDSGFSLYLNFSDPYDALLTNAIAHQDDFKGTFTQETFEKLIGKEVIIRGKVFIENTRNAYYVKITSTDQIELAD